MSVQSKLYVSITENKEREKSTGIGKTPWRNDCWRHQSSAKQMDKGLNSGQVSGGHLNTAWQSSSPFHTDSRLYTSSLLLTPLRVRVEKGILLESFQWDKLPPFQNTKWTAQMKMCYAVSSVQQSATLRGSSLLSDHTLYSVFGGQQLFGGQRPQSAAFSNKKVTRNWTEWLEGSEQTMNSSLPSEKDLHTPVQPCAWPSQETSHLSCRMREQITNIQQIMERVKEFQKNIYFHFTDYKKAFDCVDHNELWKIL